MCALVDNLENDIDECRAAVVEADLKLEKGPLCCGPLETAVSRHSPLLIVNGGMYLVHNTWCDTIDG